MNPGRNAPCPCGSGKKYKNCHFPEQPAAPLQSAAPMDLVPAGPQRYAVTLISPPGYPHSPALAEIAETLYYALLALGYDAILTTQMNEPGRRQILLGANLLSRFNMAPPSTGSIIYNFEQIDDSSAWIYEPYLALLKAYRVWDYSEQNIRRLMEKGVPHLTHVPVGYVPELERIAPAPQDIDVLFYGSLNERRQKILDELKLRGLHVHQAFGVYGAERDALVARAKIVLNVHFYESKIFEIARVSYLLANGACVVSENGPDPEEKAFAAGIALVPYEALVDTCVALAQDNDRRRAQAEVGRQLMRARPQTRYLQAILPLSGGQFSSALDPSLFQGVAVPNLNLPTILNMGSGKSWMADALNIDIDPEWNPDIVFDLGTPLPAEGAVFETTRFGTIRLKENHFDLIHSYDVLEHINQLTTAMSTCLAWLKEGGIFRINVPYDMSYGAWQDPTHVRAFNEKSWLYYTDWFWYLGWDRWRFDLMSLQYMLSPIGEALHAQGIAIDDITRTPRAVDSMLVELRKRPLNPEERAFVQERRRKDATAEMTSQMGSALPLSAPLASATVAADILPGFPEEEPAMRLIGISVVKNESDVIEAFVRHNLRFLDGLLIIDNNSADGTRDILVALQREGLPVILHDDPGLGHHQSQRMTALLQNACIFLAPDFVVPLDADEFIAAPTRTVFEQELAQIPSGVHGLIPWRTYVITPGDDPSQQHPLLRMKHRRRQENPQYYKAVIACRGTGPDLCIAEGNHSVQYADGSEAQHVRLEQTKLAHFPVRSNTQLVSKIFVGWLANLAKNPHIAQTTEAYHWHALYKRLLINPKLSAEELALISLNYAQPQQTETAITSENMLSDPIPCNFEIRYITLAQPHPEVILARMLEQQLTATAPILAGPVSQPVDVAPYRFLFDKYHPARIIHFGCDRGDYMRLFRQWGVQLTVGIDRVAQNLEYFDPEQYLPFDPGLEIGVPFDLVVCHRFIEHLEDTQVEEAMASMQRQATRIVFIPAAVGQSGDFTATSLPAEEWLARWERLGWALDVFDTLAFRELATLTDIRRSALVLTRDATAAIAPGHFTRADIQRLDQIELEWGTPGACVLPHSFSQPLPKVMIPTESNV